MLTNPHCSSKFEGLGLEAIKEIGTAPLRATLATAEWMLSGMTPLKGSGQI